MIAMDEVTPDFVSKEIDIFNLSNNGFNLSSAETIKVEINIDKEDILETLGMNSFVHIQHELEVFQKSIDARNPSLMLNMDGIATAPCFDMSLPQCCQVEVFKKEEQTVDLKKKIKSQPGPVVECFMVPESLQHLARKQGYRFEICQGKRRKRSLPYAETDWFYTGNNDSINVKPSYTLNSKKLKTNLSNCKSLLVKAHHLNAIKMQRGRQTRNMFDVEYIVDFKVMQVCIIICLIF